MGSGRCLRLEDLHYSDLPRTTNATLLHNCDLYSSHSSEPVPNIALPPSPQTLTLWAFPSREGKSKVFSCVLVGVGMGGCA